MTLEFPNRSRSFVVAKNSIRFWGYDSIKEITFLIEPNALKKLFSKAGSEEKSLLEAFDQTVERIHKGARKAYKRNRFDSFVYVLTENDF